MTVYMFVCLICVGCCAGVKVVHALCFAIMYAIVLGISAVDIFCDRVSPVTCTGYIASFLVIVRYLLVAPPC